MKYRKLPVEIDAFKFEAIIEDYPIWFNEAEEAGRVEIYGDRGDDKAHVLIETLEGKMRANFGDYIILGVAGEIYPCKPEIFEKTYEVA